MKSSMVSLKGPFAVALCVLSLASAVAACGGGTGTASSGASSTTLAPTTTLVAGQGDWPCYHHDPARSGQSSDQEAMGSVRQAWVSPALDGGLIYAQPLVVGDLVLVATEGDSLFALAADSGAVVWHTDLGTPVVGSDLPCGDINPSGITGTPVVDTKTGTLYAVAFLRTGHHHMLFALEVSTGKVLWSREIDPPGLSPMVEQQRGALALADGMVYVPYGGLAGDCGSYKGAVVAVPADGSGTALSYVVPTARMGGIWNPTGVVVDQAGDIWVTTGNSASTSQYDYGDAVIHLSPALKALDYFAPSDWKRLNRTDTDLGTTAPVLLPGGRVLVAGKSGTVYLLNASALGQVGGALTSVNAGSPAFGTVASAGTRVFVPCSKALVAVDVAGDRLTVAWSEPHGIGSPIIAAGRVWALGHDGRLRAYDPATGTVVYSTALSTPASQFITLSAANGRLFVADGAKIMALSLR